MDNPAVHLALDPPSLKRPDIWAWLQMPMFIYCHGFSVTLSCCVSRYPSYPWTTQCNVFGHVSQVYSLMSWMNWKMLRMFCSFRFFTAKFYTKNHRLSHVGALLDRFFTGKQQALNNTGPIKILFSTVSTKTGHMSSPTDMLNRYYTTTMF